MESLRETFLVVLTPNTWTEVDQFRPSPKSESPNFLHNPLTVITNFPLSLENRKRKLPFSWVSTFFFASSELRIHIHDLFQNFRS